MPIKLVALNKINNLSLPNLPRADAVVLTCTDHEKYWRWIPVAIKAWKMMNIKPYVFFIVDSKEQALPDPIKHIPELTKIVNPVKNRTTSGFAQVSRLLLPTIINAENVLISDVDYIPLPSWYYELSGGHPRNSFIVMRKKSNEAFMGFNCAHPDTWARIFKLNDRTLQGVCNKMQEWASKNIWTVKRGSDQAILNSVINKLPKDEVVVAYDGLKDARKIYMLDEDFKKHFISNKKAVKKVKITKEEITDDIIWFGNDKNMQKNIILQAYELLDYVYKNIS